MFDTAAAALPSPKTSVIVPPRNPFHQKNWHDVSTFDTYEAALTYVQKTFGADEHGRISLLRQETTEKK